MNTGKKNLVIWGMEKVVGNGVMVKVGDFLGEMKMVDEGGGGKAGF